MHSIQRNLLLTGLAGLLTSTAAAQIELGTATNFGTGVEPSGLAMADFTGDGLVDMATTTDNLDKVEILAGNGAGGFALAQTVLLGSGVSPEMLIARDVDGDGDADLAVTIKDSNAVRLVMNTGGFMTLGSQTGVGGDEPRGIDSADFDGNGLPDFVTANRDSNSMSVLLGSGGALSLSQALPAGNDPRDAAAGDFNGDGLADIAIAAHDDRNINVFFNTGGTFGGFTSLSVGGQRRPAGVTAADVNGDGTMDILAATNGNGFHSVTVFLSQGGTFSGPFHYAVGGLNPSDIATADLDLDGDMDVVVANEDSNSISALENLGGGTFGASVTVAVGANPENLDLADVDGNGSPDIGVSNRNSNNVSVILNGAANGGPSTYCMAAPNSAGAGAQIGSTGSTSIAANDFTLTASGGPAGQPYVFYYGDQQLQLPFGDGFRCVGGTTARLNPPANFSGAGSASRLVDFTSGPAASGPATISIGSTWNFQCWYRDPAALGSGFNLSNGLTATFQP